MPLGQDFRSIINDAMKTDAQYRRYLISALEILDRKPTLLVRFQEYEVEIPFMDIYCQALSEDQVHFEDLALTAIAWQHILLGKLIYRFIEVAEPPQADKEKFHNKAILMVAAEHYRSANNLYDFESVDFWGGTQGADGFIKFNEPLIRNYRGRPLTRHDAIAPLGNLRAPVSGLCKNFPLEVGYCLPHQIETHLVKTGCVARFPYGYNIIVFLESMRRNLTGRMDGVSE